MRDESETLVGDVSGPPTGRSNCGRPPRVTRGADGAAGQGPIPADRPISQVLICLLSHSPPTGPRWGLPEPEPEPNADLEQEVANNL